MAKSSAPSVQSHADIASHDKTRLLCDLLSLRRAEAVGLVHLLWHYLARSAPSDGAVRCSRASLAEELYWKPEEGDRLFDALVGSGWLEIGPDGFARAHEWRVYKSEILGPAKKRDYDRRRLQTLRQQEQMALALDHPKPQQSATIEAEADLPEAERVYVAILGNGEPPLPNDLRRIERTLEQYPAQAAYDVALNYIAWQLDVAKAYREHKRGPKPHTDLIKGYANQMRMHAKNGWSLRDTLKPKAIGRTLGFSKEDGERYASA